MCSRRFGLEFLPPRDQLAVVNSVTLSRSLPLLGSVSSSEALFCPPYGVFEGPVEGDLGFRTQAVATDCALTAAFSSATSGTPKV